MTETATGGNASGAAVNTGDASGAASGAKGGNTTSTDQQNQGQQVTPRTYTEDELNTHSAGARREGEGKGEERGKKKGRTELLTELGLESEDDLRTAVQERQKARESEQTQTQKLDSDLKKANDKATTLQGELDSAYEVIAQLKQESAVEKELAKQGINPQRIGQATKLVDLDKLDVDNDGNVTGVEDAIKAVKKEAPEFFGKPPVNIGNSGSNPGEAGSRPKTAWDLSREEFEAKKREAQFGQKGVSVR